VVTDRCPARCSAELSVVNAESERVILFAYEHDVARTRARCRLDNTASLHFFNLLVNKVYILKWVSLESLSDRAMSSRVDAILYIRRSTDVVRTALWRKWSCARQGAP